MRSPENDTVPNGRGELMTLMERGLVLLSWANLISSQALISFTTREA